MESQSVLKKEKMKQRGESFHIDINQATHTQQSKKKNNFSQIETFIIHLVIVKIKNPPLRNLVQDIITPQILEQKVSLILTLTKTADANIS